MATLNRTLRRGATGEDVREVQTLLQQAGYDPGAIDGIFGANTENAVKAFQRDHHLAVDGAVGPMTYAALTQPVPPTTGGPVRGRSLHIGLNRVNPAAYPGMTVPVLRGCINDALDMETLATGRGYATGRLHDAQATAAAVIDGISSAAAELRTGDIFLLTYSGHGSQVPDLDADEEPDALDETWVLYDRQMLDDERYALWGQFAPGVRILVFSDSCHSATVSRALLQATQAEVAAKELTRGVTGNGDSGGGGFTADQVRLTLTLAESVRPTVAALAGGGGAVAVQNATSQVIGPLLERITASSRAAGGQPAPTARAVSAADAKRDFDRRRTVYRAAKAMTRGSVPPSASVLTFSACQDNQVAMDGTRNGLFTQNVKAALAQQPSTYPDLFAKIMALMPGSQTPNLSWVPGRDVAFEGQAPFTI
jgi:hypothetical protein